MVKRTLLFAVIIGLVVSAIFFFRWFRHRDECQIRKNLNTLASLVSKSPGESSFILVGRAKNAADDFTEDCLISVGSELQEIKGRDEIPGTIILAQNFFTQLTATPVDITVRIGEDKKTAQSGLTLKVVGYGPASTQPFLEAREIEIDWQKPEKKWLLSEVHPVSTLR